MPLYLLYIASHGHRTHCLQEINIFLNGVVYLITDHCVYIESNITDSSVNISLKYWTIIKTQHVTISNMLLSRLLPKSVPLLVRAVFGGRRRRSSSHRQSIFHFPFVLSCFPTHLVFIPSLCVVYFKSNQIKFIYIALRTSADISKCCTETQPKTPNNAGVEARC